MIPVSPERLDAIFEALRAEIESATEKFPSFNSGHEGYAVILEELNELWDDVKADRIPESLVEALQVAAMAVRFIIDCSALERPA